MSMFHCFPEEGETMNKTRQDKNNETRQAETEMALLTNDLTSANSELMPHRSQCLQRGLLSKPQTGHRHDC